MGTAEGPSLNFTDLYVPALSTFQQDLTAAFGEHKYKQALSADLDRYHVICTMLGQDDTKWHFLLYDRTLSLSCL
jgi:hypothetical protein